MGGLSFQQLLDGSPAGRAKRQKQSQVAAQWVAEDFGGAAPKQDLPSMTPPNKLRRRLRACQLQRLARRRTLPLQAPCTTRGRKRLLHSLRQLSSRWSLSCWSRASAIAGKRRPAPRHGDFTVTPSSESSPEPAPEATQAPTAAAASSSEPPAANCTHNQAPAPVERYGPGVID